MWTIFLVSSTFFLQVTADCPDGYLKHQGSCYRFHHSEFTWPESVAFCRAYGSNLLRLETEAEFTFIKGKAKEAGGSGYWTGGSDALDENEWIWVENGERVTLTGDWAPNEPDHVAGRDCLGLYGAANFELGAYDCRHLLRPVCEIDATVSAQDLVG